MEFKDFSLHIAQTRVGRFARDLASSEIMATRCTNCRKTFYPPRADCPHCMRSDMAWTPLKGRGRLVTFTRIHVPPEHFSPKTSMPFSSITFHPCPVGLLEVQDGLRIMGWIPNIELKEIRIGMSMRATPKTLENGTVTIILEPIDPVFEAATDNT